jgi:NAD+ synthase (glutamine-hydrolysing)
LPRGSKQPANNVLAYTLRGFATSEEANRNAWPLINTLGANGGKINIRPGAGQLLTDLRQHFVHGEVVSDIAFENVQAELRTDYLFRLDNEHRLWWSAPAISPS